MFWPEGVHYTKFLGKLNEDKVIKDPNLTQTHQHNTGENSFCTRAEIEHFDSVTEGSPPPDLSSVPNAEVKVD
jgi:hypothetical protein